MKTYTLFILFLAFSSVFCDGEHESGVVGWSDDAIGIRAAIFLVLSSLIFVSIAFEVFKERLSEMVSKRLHPILDALWSELMVGGFLGLVLFAVDKTGVLEIIGRKAFGEDEIISDMYETIHLLLFFVFVIFLGQVLLLLNLATRIKRAWKQAEKASKHPEQVIERYQLVAHRWHTTSTLHHLIHLPLRWEYNSAVHDMEFMRMRIEFISPRDPTQRKLPRDFDYSLYLTLLMVETLGRIIVIHPLSWLSLWSLLFVFFFATSAPVQVQMILFVTMGWIILLILVGVSWHLDSARQHLLPPLPKSIKKLQKSIQAREGINEEEDERRSLIDQIWEALPQYLSREIRPRTPVGKRILGPPPNKHELLFILDRHGPNLVLNVVRTLLLLISVFLAVFGFQVSVLIWDNFPVGVRWVLYVVALLPFPLIALSYAPHILRRYVVTTNIEMLKKPRTIREVVQYIRTRKALRTLRLLNSIRAYTKRMKRLAQLKDEVGKPKEEKKEHKGKQKALSEEKIAEIRSVFNLFDKDGSGTISNIELRDMMKTLGQNVTKEEAALIISQVDTQGDGELDFNEFMEFMRDTAEEGEQSIEKLVDDLFELFDQDGSGSISSEEFRQMLTKLGTTLTKDDIDHIIKDLDKDDDGTINLEEFKEMVEKFGEFD